MDNTVWCFECFNNNPEIHKGHRVLRKACHSALCDCGDTSAIDPIGFCPKHKGNQIIDKSVLSLVSNHYKQISDIYRSYFRTTFEWISELTLTKKARKNYFVKTFTPMLNLMR